MTRQEVQAEVVRAAAAAAEGTAGVAFLRPGLADLVRGSAAARSLRAATGSPGVRVQHRGTPESWHVQLHLAVLRGHQAAAVTRAVRASVEAAVTAVLTARASVRVTVTVTDII